MNTSLKHPSIYFQSLSAKIFKLEHMAHLKDIRVKDLMVRLEKLGLTTPEDYAQQAQQQVHANQLESD